MNAPMPVIHTVTLHLRTLKGGSAPVEIVHRKGMTLLCAIKEARGTLPATWVDGFSCHSGACNVCSITINGQPGVPCTVFLRDLGHDVAVGPGSHADGWDGLRNPVRGGH